jgi:cytosine deaminase
VTITTALQDVRPWGGEASDVHVDESSIRAIVPVGSPVPEGATAEPGNGRILLPSFSDVHVHLDSTRMGLPYRPRTGGPTLWDRIMDDRANWRSAGGTVAERATYTWGQMVAQGTTRARSYAQVDTDCGFERLSGVLAARDAHADRASLEVVAFPQAGLFLEPGSVELLDEAMLQGADVVGGIDPCGLDKDPVRHLDTVFALAEKHQAGIDIHLHEEGVLGLFSAGLILDRVAAHAMQGRVTIAHATALASGHPDVPAVIARLAQLDVAVTNVAPPGKGALPIVALAEAGVRLGLGEDGQRDYWSPYGNGDMLDRTWQLAFTQRFLQDELIEHALAVATWGGAGILDTGLARVAGPLARAGTGVGDPSELVLLTGDAPAAAVMDRSPDRVVVHAGRVVARGGQLI